MNSFQFESIFQKQNCHHTIFNLDVSKFQIPSLSASAERSQISQHNGVPIMSTVQQSETVNKKYKHFGQGLANSFC